MDSQDPKPLEGIKPIFRKNRPEPKETETASEPPILWVPPGSLEQPNEGPSPRKTPGPFRTNPAGKNPVVKNAGLATPEEPSSEPAEPNPTAPAGEIPPWLQRLGIPTTPGENPAKAVFEFLLRSRIAALFAGIAAGAAIASLFHSAGDSKQKKLLASIDPLETKAPAPKHAAQFEAALDELRRGEPAKARETLAQLQKEYPFIPSLSYFAALAALQTGDTTAAATLAGESVGKRERIADSLALQALVESQKPRAGALRDPAAAAGALLEKAATIEPGNPAPLIELSTILRFKGDQAAALETMRRARNRLNPVDSHAVADTTIRLLELQAMDDASLPANIDPDTGTAAMFSAAYVAMRTGRFADAASILSTAQKRLPPDLFLYLANDPALRRFKDQPELSGFFD